MKRKLINTSSLPLPDIIFQHVSFADDQLGGGGGARPTPSFSITALKGWVAPSSLDSLQQTQSTHFPLHFQPAYGDGGKYGKPEEKRNKHRKHNM